MTWVKPEGLRDNILPIELNEEDRLVRCGDTDFSFAQVIGYAWVNIMDVLFREGKTIIMGYTEYKKADPKINYEAYKNKKYSGLLGLPPKMYTKVMKGVVMGSVERQLGSIVHPYLMKLCYDRRGFVPYRVMRLLEHKQEAEQLVAENKESLIPFLLLSSRSIIKEAHEKGLHNNSFSRNALIVRTIDNSTLRQGLAIDELTSVPSTLLKHSRMTYWFNEPETMIVCGMMKRHRKMAYLQDPIKKEVIYYALRAVDIKWQRNIHSRDLFADPINPTDIELEMSAMILGFSIEETFLEAIETELPKEIKRHARREELRKASLQESKNRKGPVMESIDFF